MGKNQTIRFETVILKVDAFIIVELPFSPREAWGAQPRYPVRGTINGQAVRGTLGALGQEYFLRLSAKWLKASGLVIGEKVKVSLALEDRT